MGLPEGKTNGNEAEIELINNFTRSGPAYRDKDPAADFTVFSLSWDEAELRDAKRLSKLWDARNLSADDLVIAHRSEAHFGLRNHSP